MLAKGVGPCESYLVESYPAESDSAEAGSACGRIGSRLPATPIGTRRVAA